MNSNCSHMLQISARRKFKLTSFACFLDRNMDKKDNNDKDKGATPKSKKCAAKPHKQKKTSNLLSSSPCNTRVQNLAPRSASHTVAKPPVSGASAGEMEGKIDCLEKMLLTQSRQQVSYGGFYYGEPTTTISS